MVDEFAVAEAVGAAANVDEAGADARDPLSDRLPSLELDDEAASVKESVQN